ncbi:MAG: carboxypeptidase regulatory-like domain-containing protein [Acidobacteriota bacterium]
MTRSADRSGFTPRPVIATLLALGLMLGSSALGGQERSEKETSEQETLIVRGQVLAPTGEGVAGAQVMLRGPQAPYFFGTTTRKAGRFETREATPGTFTVFVSSQVGFVPPFEIELKSGAEPEDLRIQLKAGATLSGRVTDGDGMPVAGARVSLGPPPGRGGTLAPHGHRAGSTDRDGRFEIRGIASGQYPVSAKHQDFEAITDRVDLEDGGTSEITLSFTQRRQLLEVTRRVPANSASLEPEGGAVREPIPGYQLTGQALRDGIPWPLARADISCPGTRFRAQAKVQDGRFVLNEVPATPCGVRIVDAQQPAVRLEQEIHISGDETVTFEVATRTIAGQVVDARSRQPIAGATVELKGELPIPTPPPSTSDAEGRFAFTTAADTAWRLRTAAEGFASAEHAVDAGQAPRIALEPAVTAVLFVRDSQGKPPISVSMNIRDPEGATVESVTYRPDAEGRIELSTLGAGRWQVELHLGDGQHAIFEMVLPGEPIHVQASKTGAVRLDATP